VRTASDLKATMIIAITDTGATARILAKYRPKQLILALCMSAGVIRQLNIIRGVFTLKIPSFLGSDNLIDCAINFAYENGYLKKDDTVVCLLGENEETPDYTNIMKISVVK
jgi:pyruvate kinase